VARAFTTGRAALISLKAADGNPPYRDFCHCRTAPQGSCDLDIEPPDSRIWRLFSYSRPGCGFARLVFASVSDNPRGRFADSAASKSYWLGLSNFPKWML
jgi:hypothetical protein